MTTNGSEMAQFFFDMLDGAKTVLGLKGVAYGDQEKIPFVPFACVEPGITRRDLNGAPRRALVQMDTHIIVYLGQVRDVQRNLKESEQLIEAIRDLVHADATLGGRVFYSLVREIEPGYQKRGTSLFRATMLTVEARQQELLPLNF